MALTKEYIGRTLIQLRLQKENMSQKKLGKMAGFHQSTISRLESDLQPANEEQIKALASSLGITPEQLLNLAAPTLNIEQQMGGYANNYLIQYNSDIIKAKDDVIAAKDEIIALKNQLIADLENKIKSLENK